MKTHKKHNKANNINPNKHRIINLTRAQSNREWTKYVRNAIRQVREKAEK